jgi:hypothetical protein
VKNNFGIGIESVKIYYGTSEFTLTNSQGNWVIANLSGQRSISSYTVDYTFYSYTIPINSYTENILFEGTIVLSEK